MSRAEIFEEIMLPHLDAAHNLARRLTRSHQDAQDVVQEACLRAFRFFDGYRGGDAKAWLLEIVRLEPRRNGLLGRIGCFGGRAGETAGSL